MGVLQTHLRIDGLGCRDLPDRGLDKPLPGETGRGTDAKAVRDRIRMVIAAEASRTG